METCSLCGAEIPPVVSSVVEKNIDGSTKKWTEEVRDSHGAVVWKRIDEYTYYKEGVIDKINQKVYDSKNALTSEKEVKHYTDGSQPIVSNISAVGG